MPQNKFCGYENPAFQAKKVFNSPANLCLKGNNLHNRRSSTCGVNLDEKKQYSVKYLTKDKDCLGYQKRKNGQTQLRRNSKATPSQLQGNSHSELFQKSGGKDKRVSSTDNTVQSVVYEISMYNKTDRT
jgi:hypothetical protein